MVHVHHRRERPRIRVPKPRLLRAGRTGANGYSFGPEMLSATGDGKWVSYECQNPLSGLVGLDFDHLELKNVWAARLRLARKFTKSPVDEAIARFHAGGWGRPWPTTTIRIASRRQLHHLGNRRLGCGVDGSTASIPVDQRGGSLLPAGRQDAPDLAFADSKAFGPVWTTPRSGRQIILKTSESVTPRVRPKPRWPRSIIAVTPCME